MKNKTVNFIRGIATLLIVYYHIYAVTNVSFKYEIINCISGMLGEIGVSIFFLISGYGIYTSLKRKGDKFSYKEYIKSRFKRIAPQYYLCFFVCLLFTSGSAYISKVGYPSIFTHLIFIHNLFLNHHGAINGSLWTMGTIFQFYLFAPLLFKLIEKKPKTVTILSIVVTIMLKYLVLGVLIPIYAPADRIDSYFFVYSRQILWTLDNFIIGMFIAKILYNYDFETKTKFHNIILTIISFVGVMFVVLIGSNFLNVPYFFGPLYTASIKAYTWHSILSVALGIFIFLASKIKIKEIIYKPIDFIAKHEYGIYLWHLPIMYNLIANSNIVQTLILNNNLFIYVFLFVITVIFGIFMSKLFEKEKIREKTKEEIKFKNREKILTIKD